MNSNRKWAAACGLAFLFLVTDASGAVIGHLDIANCTGGGVTVSGSFIDFLPGNSVESPGTGCVQTGSGTNVSFGAGSTLGPGIQGAILDLVFNPANPPVPGFMTFTGLDFTLTSIGPGVTNAVCAAVLDPNLPSCSVGGNTPFILTPNSTGTSITLSAIGTVSDGSSPPSNFIGAFTTQIAGQTPLSINNTILAGGSVTSTNSGDFEITTTGVIPEPSTISMAVLGGLLVAFAARRKSRV